MAIGNYIEEKIIQNWMFQMDQDDLGEKEEWFSNDHNRNDWNIVTVPGAWDYYDKALLAYEGIGWYFAEIPGEWANSELWQRVRFQSVSGHTKVWINGSLMGENTGRYLPFEVAATPSLYYDRTNILVIRTDNAPRHEWLPGSLVIEWVQYGGILQPVSLLGTNPCYISDMAIHALPEGTGAHVECEIELTNCAVTDFTGNICILASIEGDFSQNVEVICPKSSKTVKRVSLNIPFIKKWELDSPVLYGIKAVITEKDIPLHSVYSKFGLRTIETRGNQILLNGKPLFIKGVNRYDEYAPYGTTVPVDLIRKDLECIKETGANLIRVHYPQDTVHLEIADELGLLYMEEIPLNWWRPKEEEIEIHNRIIKSAEEFLEKMIRRDRNHPCLIAWSMTNESDTNTRIGMAAMKKLIQNTRELDGTRLVTFVVDYLPDGEELKEVDFIAYNAYCGLHHGEFAHHISDMVKLVKEPTEARLKEIVELYPNKPVVITEYGSMSIIGLRGDNRFSEAHHAAYIEKVWQAINNVSGVQGGVLWSWADYYHRRDFIGRGNHIHSVFGPYGVVTAERTPKQLPVQALARMYSNGR